MSVLLLGAIFSNSLAAQCEPEKIPADKVYFESRECNAELLGVAGYLGCPEKYRLISYYGVSHFNRGESYVSSPAWKYTWDASFEVQDNDMWNRSGGLKRTEIGGTGNPPDNDIPVPIALDLEKFIPVGDLPECQDYWANCFIVKTLQNDKKVWQADPDDGHEDNNYGCHSNNCVKIASSDGWVKHEEEFSISLELKDTEEAALARAREGAVTVSSKSSSYWRAPDPNDEGFNPGSLDAVEFGFREASFTLEFWDLCPGDYIVDAVFSEQDISYDGTVSEWDTIVSKRYSFSVEEGAERVFQTDQYEMPFKKGKQYTFLGASAVLQEDCQGNPGGDFASFQSGLDMGPDYYMSLGFGNYGSDSLGYLTLNKDYVWRDDFDLNSFQFHDTSENPGWIKYGADNDFWQIWKGDYFYLFSLNGDSVEIRCYQIWPEDESTLPRIVQENEDPSSGNNYCYDLSEEYPAYTYVFQPFRGNIDRAGMTAIEVNRTLVIEKYRGDSADASPDLLTTTTYHIVSDTIDDGNITWKMTQQAGSDVIIKTEEISYEGDLTKRLRKVLVKEFLSADDCSNDHWVKSTLNTYGIRSNYFRILSSQENYHDSGDGSDIRTKSWSYISGEYSQNEDFEKTYTDEFGETEVYELHAEPNQPRELRIRKNFHGSNRSDGVPVRQHVITTNTSLDDQVVTIPGYGQTQAGTLYTRTETMDGMEISRTYSFKENNPAEDSGRAFHGLLVHEWIVETSKPGAEIHDSSNMVTSIRRYASSPHKNKIEMIMGYDGTVVLIDRNIANNVMTKTMEMGQPDDATDPSSVVFGTRVVTITNRQGYVIDRQIYQIPGDGADAIQIGSDSSIISVVDNGDNTFTYNAYVDNFGRVTKVYHNDGTYSDYSYSDCCDKLATESHPFEGISKEYHTDLLGRLREIVENGITTVIDESFDTQMNNSPGLLQLITRLPRGYIDDGTMEFILDAQNKYDLGGQLVKSLDQHLYNTDYKFDASANDSPNTYHWRETYNDESYQTNYYFRDGRLAEVSGNAAFPKRYEYDFESDTHDGQTFNASVTTVIYQSTGGESDEWMKVYYDMLGRVYKTEMPSDDGTQSVFSYLFYGDNGQIHKYVDPDGVTTLYGYDVLGNLEVVAVVEDPDQEVIDTETNSNDRIVKLSKTVETNIPYGGENYTVHRFTSSTYINGDEGGAMEQILKQVDVTLDGLESWETSFESGQPLVIHTSSQYELDPNTLEPTGGRILTVTRPDETTIVSYYQNGLLREIEHSDTGEGNRYEYDEFDRLWKTLYYKDLSGGDVVQTITYTYEPQSDRVGQVTYTYSDPQVNPTETYTYAYQYDVDYFRDEVTGPEGTQTYEYNKQGLLWKQYGAKITPLEYAYDSQGRISKMFTWRDYTNDVGKKYREWIYNKFTGNLSRKTDEMGRAVSYTYTPAGRVDTHTSPNNILTQYEYNVFGDVQNILYSDNNTPDVSYTYDRQGRYQTVVDGSGIREISYPGSAQNYYSEKYTNGPLAGYEVRNPLATHSRPGGANLLFNDVSKHSYTYDYDETRNYIDTISTSSFSLAATITRNPEAAANTPFYTLSRGIVGSDSLVSSEYRKDNGLLQKKTTQFGSSNPFLELRYEYNVDNRLQYIKKPATAEGTEYWHFDYDNRGQLKSSGHYLTDDQDFTPQNSSVYPGSTQNYVFDDIGNLNSSDSLPFNGNRTTTLHSNLNQPENQSQSRALSIYGTSGNTDQIDTRLETFNNVSPSTYSSLPPNQFVAQFDLSQSQDPVDDGGPLWEKFTATGVYTGGVSPPYQSDYSGHIFLPRNPESFEYDKNGNLSKDGRYRYYWDAENRLISVQTRSDVAATISNLFFPQYEVNFTYDAEGRRISKQVYNYRTQESETTWFLYDGWQLIHEFTADEAAGTVEKKFYTWGPDLSGDVNGAGGIGGLLMIHNEVSEGFFDTYYPIYDGRGNIISLIDAGNGSSAAEYEYDPFGNLVTVSGPYAYENPFRYSTKYADDETGLVYYGYRYYAPRMNRWMSADPLGEAGSDNLFAFVDNDPVNNVDPLGLKKCPGLYASAGACGQKVLSSSLQIMDPALRSEFGIDCDDINAVDLEEVGWFVGEMIVEELFWYYIGGPIIERALEKAFSALLWVAKGGIGRTISGWVERSGRWVYRHLDDFFSAGARSARGGFRASGRAGIGMRGWGHSSADGHMMHASGKKSPTITADELSNKTRTEIRDLADNKNLEVFGDTTSPDHPRKWKDPVTKKERIRLDRGHVDKRTGKPYNNPKAANDHVHGYEADGKKITVDGDPHIPTIGE